MKRGPFPNRSPIRPAGNCAANAALCCLVLIFGVCGVARAQLRWESRSLEFHPSFADTKVTAEFHFTNIGQKPVRITDVTTSCGCTTAMLDKRHVYVPGEKGTITALFDIGGRNEPQKETLFVKTTDPKEPELVLQFTVAIPKLLDIDNIFLNWGRGEELKPKVVNIKILGDYPVHHLDVSSSNPNMTTEIRHAEGSRDFQLVVTPKKADGEFVIVDIKPDFPKDPPKIFHVYAITGR